MGNTPGVRRDLEALEQRRKWAARLLSLSQAEVGRKLGVHRQSVSRWARQLQQAGRAALKRAGRAERKPRLTPRDLRRIERRLKRGIGGTGEVSILTCRGMAEFIREQYRVDYHPGHVWRILQRLGWSCRG